MNTSLPNDVRNRIQQLHWMPTALVSERLGVPAEQVEAVVAEMAAASRERLLEARRRKWTPVAVIEQAAPKPAKKRGRRRVPFAKRAVSVRVAAIADARDFSASKPTPAAKPMAIPSPTPEEIAERAAAIRSTWSEAELQLRYWQSRTFYGAAQLAERAYTFPQLSTIDWSIG